jgi:type-F conjugative transfer system protein TrbI
MRLTQASALITSTLFGVILATYFMPHTPSVVIFDAHALKAQWIHQLALHKVTDAQITHATQKFKTLLHATLIQYSQKNKVVILDKSRVLSGGIDITKEITKDLKVTIGNHA